MKRVLIISNTKILGGAEIVLQNYLQNNFTHDIYLYTTSLKEISESYMHILQRQRMFCSKTMTMVSIRRHPIMSLYNIIKNIIQIHKIVKEKRIDVLYGNNTVDIVLVVLYKLFVNSKIKVISHIHDILTRRLYLMFIKKYNSYVNLFITPSMAGKKSFQSYVVNSEKIKVIYNGVSVNTEKKNIVEVENVKFKYKIPRNKKVICFIGQLCKRKRVDMFVEIIKELNNKETRYVGLIVGKKVELDYASMIEKQLDSNFIYVGELKQADILNDIYPVSDGLLLTSDQDPLPTVVLEAMSRGCLVFARNVDGVPEMIQDGKTGILFGYNDDVVSIAKKMDMVFNGDRVKNLEYNAMENIKKRFSNKKKQDLINQIIEDL